MTILCRQFPLILKSNDTDLKCARLRTDTSVSTGDFNLQDPSAIILFTILNLSLTSSNFNDITIDFDLSSDQPASIVDIRLALLVTYGQFSINNQTTNLYNSSMIPILHWKNGIFNRYDVIDTIVLEDKLFYDDSSLCKWDLQFWNHLFHDENFPHVPYSYFLQLNTSQLHFTLVGTKNTSALPTTPSPFLNVLYCIPFMMEPTEIVLISLFSFIVCISLIGGCIWHCFRKDYNKPPNYFDLHHQQMVTPLEKDKKNHVRYRSSASLSASASECNDPSSG